MIQPEYINLKNWSASLLVDYATYNIPILFDEKKWKSWASDLLNSPPFRGMNIPLPGNVKNKNQDKESEEDEWRTWARIVYYIMNKVN